MKDTLNIIASILLKSLIAGFILLLTWFVFFLTCPDCVYTLHAKWFTMTNQQFDLINYCGMGIFKLWLIILFLLPWIAIKLTVKKL